MTSFHGLRPTFKGSKRPLRERRCAPEEASLSVMSDTSLRSQIMRGMRPAPRCLAVKRKQLCAELLAHNVDCWLHLRPSWRIALYAALPEELDTTPLIELARAARLPHLSAAHRSPQSRAQDAVRGDERPPSIQPTRDREPEGSRIIGARWLDVVFLPLVGFDARGVRLGNRRRLLRSRLRVPTLAQGVAHTAAHRSRVFVSAGRSTSLPPHTTCCSMRWSRKKGSYDALLADEDRARHFRCR